VNFFRILGLTMRLQSNLTHRKETQKRLNSIEFFPCWIVLAMPSALSPSVEQREMPVWTCLSFHQGNRAACVFSYYEGELLLGTFL
jgi:hypothetical protein